VRWTRSRERPYWTKTAGESVSAAGSTRVGVVFDRRNDASRKVSGAAAVDQLQQSMEVVGGILRQAGGQLVAEAGVTQTPLPPGDRWVDVELKSGLPPKQAHVLFACRDRDLLRP
jgi:hypothetical protein